MIEPGAKNSFVRIVWLILFLGVLSVIFDFRNFHIRDLSQNEGLYAAVAAGINADHPMSIVHGVGIKNNYFLYPWLCSLFHRFTEFQLPYTMRYINFFFMAATALLIGLTAGFTRDFKAGMVGISFFCANLFVFMYSQYASPLMMSLFLLFSAQSAWVYFGFSKGKWNWAWISSLFLLSCGFLSGGIKIVIYFFLPLLFMHRPLKISSKINKKGFVLGVLFILGALIFKMMPQILYSRTMEWTYMPLAYRGMGNFLLNIIWSPVQLLLVMLPWTLLIWMPFCAAIRPLDKTPIFSHYFRVIFITDFLFTLLNPLSTMDDFMFTLPPLALLCAITYDTAVRRYSVEMRHLILICGYIPAILAAVLMIYCFCPYELVVQHVNFLPLTNGKERIFSAILAFFALSIWIYHYRKHGQLWLIMLFTGGAIGLFCQLTFIPYINSDRSRSELGSRIRQIIEEDCNTNNAVVYKKDILDLYSESYYMHKEVNKIDSLDNIDNKKKVIYLLTTDFPQYPERTWKNLFETTYRGRKLCLYRGEITKRKELINRRNQPPAADGDKK
ncbi:MAG: hypothetical protein IKB71_05865 [Lentisphaeria bacterium]|nr:hypothetical protein [Lentisphaeria bacterium]